MPLRNLLYSLGRSWFQDVFEGFLTVRMRKGRLVNGPVLA